MSSLLRGIGGRGALPRMEVPPTTQKQRPGHEKTYRRASCARTECARQHSPDHRRAGRILENANRAIHRSGRGSHHRPPEAGCAAAGTASPLISSPAALTTQGTASSEDGSTERRASVKAAPITASCISTEAPASDHSFSNFSTANVASMWAAALSLSKSWANCIARRRFVRSDMRRLLCGRRRADEIGRDREDFAHLDQLCQFLKELAVVENASCVTIERRGLWRQGRAAIDFSNLAQAIKNGAIHDITFKKRIDRRNGESHRRSAAQALGRKNGVACCDQGGEVRWNVGRAFSQCLEKPRGALEALESRRCDNSFSRSRQSTGITGPANARIAARASSRSAIDCPLGRRQRGVDSRACILGGCGASDRALLQLRSQVHQLQCIVGTRSDITGFPARDAWLGYSSPARNLGLRQSAFLTHAADKFRYFAHASESIRFRIELQYEIKLLTCA